MNHKFILVIAARAFDYNDGRINIYCCCYIVLTITTKTITVISLNAISVLDDRSRYPK